MLQMLTPSPQAFMGTGFSSPLAGMPSAGANFIGQSPLTGGQSFQGGFASSFSPSPELGGNQDLSRISGVLQGLMMTTMMMQIMQMMQMLQSLVSGQAGVPAGANFGSQSAGANPIAGGSTPISSAGDSGSSGSSAAGASKASPNKTGKIVDVPGGRLDEAVAGAFIAMKEAAKKDGVDLQISSSYRSRQEQEVLYAKYKAGTGNLAAKPGTSNHESGLAIDFKNTPKAYDWLAKNAERFGLKNLPGEPWHYSPNGK